MSPAVTAGAGQDVLAAFLDNVDANPQHPAAKDNTCDLDYAGLFDAVAALAAGLATRGVGRDDRVALQVPNSVDFLTAALACLWVGAMFVPLAAVDPPARVAAIVDDCAPALVLTNALVSEPHPSAIAITAVATTAAQAPEPVRSGGPGYAIYTSGTTGTPKGVVIGRSAFAAAIRDTVDILGLTSQARGLCVSPFHFDGSFGTLFPVIVAGGSLVIPPRDALLFPRYFFRTVAREHITVTGFSPSYLRLLLAAPQLDSLAATDLRVIALGGEACSAPDVETLYRVAPEVRVFNRYGPTETTIAVAYFEVQPETLVGAGPVPIGPPNDGVAFVLVGDDGTIIEEDGAVGELYIGGDQLMDGYWDAPELTAGVMRADIVPGQLVYRSGDLMRRDTEGNYVYVDRADRVIKRNAVRISLVELADVLRGLPGVAAVTCATFDNGGELGIVAFVVSPGSGAATDLRRAAAERLPTSMLPDVIEVVAELPLTSSSKVDERSLLAAAGLRPV